MSTTGFPGSPPTHIQNLAAGPSLSGNIGGSTATSGQILAIENPEGVPIIVTHAVLHVITGSSGAAALSVGVAANATTSSTTLFSSQSVNTGANTVYQANPTATGYMAATDYLTATVASGDVTGLVARLDAVYYKVPS